MPLSAGYDPLPPRPADRNEVNSVVSKPCSNDLTGDIVFEPLL
jgi:hypothetical protein